MQTLWGAKGRPETEAYADRCAEQQRNKRQLTSLVVREIVKGTHVVRETPAPKQAESKRTQDKWAAARERARQQGLVATR